MAARGGQDGRGGRRKALKAAGVALVGSLLLGAGAAGWAYWHLNGNIRSVDINGALGDDLLTYAQSWHWTDPTLAVPEALRVLRPGGALALWWNTDAHDVPWIADSGRRIDRHFAGLNLSAEKRNFDARFADPTGNLDFVHHEIRWSRRVPLDTHLANLGSHSVFLTDTEERATAFFAEERRHLLAVFPDGLVEETYDVHLLLAPTSTT